MLSRRRTLLLALCAAALLVCAAAALPAERFVLKDGEEAAYRYRTSTTLAPGPGQQETGMELACIVALKSQLAPDQTHLIVTMSITESHIVPSGAGTTQ